MRKLIAAGLLILTSTGAFAQNDDNGYSDGSQRKMYARCSKLYIDLGTGLNANTGLLGGGVDYHVAKDISINAGLGLLSSWGNKFYIGGKGYLKPCHKDWAFGGGLTYNTGLSKYTSTQETIYGTNEEVTLDLLPQTCVYLSAFKYWKLGHKGNRFYMQLGWSRSMNAQKFKQISGTPVSSNSAAITRFISPGGLVFGLGFSFGT
jgi:hypothetical protein